MNNIKDKRYIFPTQLDVEKYLKSFYQAKDEIKLFHDNYGLLSKNPNKIVRKIMLCTTPTYKISNKMENENYDLLISHHDLRFEKIDQIIFHSIMDEEKKYGHNIFFAKKIGLNNINFKSVIVKGNLYKPFSINDLPDFLKKKGFDIEGKIHKNTENDELINSVIYCSGHGGMLINDSSLQSMNWANDPNFDLRNVEADVYITGQLLDERDLSNNKFKYIIELGHTNSEKPLFHWIKKRLLNKWPLLKIDLADKSIDYYGSEKLTEFINWTPEDDIENWNKHFQEIMKVVYESMRYNEKP